MGTIRKPQEVKLFTGIIAVSEELVDKVFEELVEIFARIDVRSPIVAFDFTDYYSAEMGGKLLRLWAGFERPIDPSELAAIKITTNGLEEKYSVSGGRRINIDPGYITPAKVVLASTKDFSHRLYLSAGIYGEVTLMYKHKNFVPLEWTYPDYKSEAALKFLAELRLSHMERANNGPLK